jgi:hypothetical protein
MLKSGARVKYTQSPQNLEELLGKFIFSMQGSDKDKKGTAPAPQVAAGAAAAPAATPANTADHP